MARTHLIKLAVLLLLITSFIPKKHLSKQDILNTLCKAINEKKQVKFYYDDKYSDFTDWRVVEPHLVGDHKSTGNTTLVAWFLPTQQQSSKGHTEEWGNYLLDRIESLQILNKTFQRTRPKYNPNDSRMSAIHCNVQKTY